jgi:hypothetical protein
LQDPESLLALSAPIGLTYVRNEARTERSAIDPSSDKRAGGNVMNGILNLHHARAAIMHDLAALADSPQRIEGGDAEGELAIPPALQ